MTAHAKAPQPTTLRLRALKIERRDLGHLLKLTEAAEAEIAQRERPALYRSTLPVSHLEPPNTVRWCMGDAARLCGGRPTKSDIGHLDVHWQRLQLRALGYPQPSWIVRARLKRVQRSLASLRDSS